jgi:hypothetical protein
VAAAAPATDLATLMTDDLNTTGGHNLTAMTVWSWSRVYGAPVDGIVASSAISTIDRLAEECIGSPFDIFRRGGTAASLAEEFPTTAVPCAGFGRWPGTAAGHARLVQAVVQGRDSRADAGHARCQPRFCRRRQRQIRIGVDGGPLCRPACAKRLRRLKPDGMLQLEQHWGSPLPS